MTDMNRLIESQSLQSRFSTVVASQVATSKYPLLDEMALDAKRGHHFVVILVANLDKVSMNAIRYAKLFSGEIVAVHILLNSSERQEMESQWEKQNIDIPLLLLESSNDSIIEPLTTYVDGIHHSHKESVVTIVLPVLLTLKWWHRYLHGQTARLIESHFKLEAGVVTVRVPFSPNNN
ncbi:MAG: hypothetical protein ACLPN1_03895 [Dissulfurispiraceae bacterium]|jgi:hypothetical protein